MSEANETILAGDTEMEELRATVRALLEGSKLSIGAAARQSGIAVSTFSSWLSRSYTGDNLRVAEQVRTWLDNREAAARARAAAPLALGFVATRSAEAFNAVLEHAQYMPDLVVIAGGAGVGKTTACERYAAEHRNCWLLTAAPSLASAHAMLEYACETIGVRENAPARRARALAARLRGTGGVLIVDEAQHLRTATFDELRSLHDRSGVGMAFVGNESIHMRMDGGGRRSEFAQVFSRVGMRVSRARPLARDVEAILDAAGVRGTSERAFLKQVAAKPGALRGVIKCLRVAAMLAGHAGLEAPDVQHLATAWSRLTDTLVQEVAA